MFLLEVLNLFLLDVHLKLKEFSFLCERVNAIIKVVGCYDVITLDQRWIVKQKGRLNCVHKVIARLRYEKIKPATLFLLRSLVLI